MSGMNRYGVLNESVICEDINNGNVPGRGCE